MSTEHGGGGQVELIRNSRQVSDPQVKERRFSASFPIGQNQPNLATPHHGHGLVQPGAKGPFGLDPNPSR